MYRRGTLSNCFSLLGLIVFCSCAPGCGNQVMNEVMQSWHGAHIDEVISRWGYPDRERTVAGRHIYEWDYTETATTPAYTTGTTNVIGNTAYGQYTTQGGETNTLYLRRTLEVDAAGYVIASQWQGNMNWIFGSDKVLANWGNPNAIK